MAPQQLVFAFLMVSAVSMFAMIVFIRRYEHLERMRMIERGFNPADMKSALLKRDPYRHLRLSCTAIGIGVGWFVGTILRREVWHGSDIMVSMIVFMGGVGLFIGYMVQYRLQTKARQDDQSPLNEEI